MEHAFGYLTQVDCPPTWRPGARLCLLGEAPGAEEVKRREGFVGSSGKLLDKMLLAAGLSREDISLSNVVKRRPPDNDFSCFYAGKQPTAELQAWRAELARELEEARQSGLRVVVACGNEALKALLGVGQISARRGSAWRREDGLWVVGMLHPAAILRGALWQEVVVSVECCLRRAKWLAEHPEWEPPSYNVEVGGGEECAEWLSREIPLCRRWSLDLETLPGDAKTPGKISVLGLAVLDQGGETYAFVTRWPSRALWPALRQALSSWGSKLVGHNLLYDAAYLQHVEAWPPGCRPAFDTMQRWHGLFPELPKSLEFCTMWALGKELPYWKDEGKKLHRRVRSSDEEMRYLLYCVKDAVAALWLSGWLDEEAARRKWSPPAWEQSNWLRAQDMTRTGVQLDAPEVERVQACVLSTREQARQALQDLAPGLNPNSPTQVMKLLYDELKLPIQTKGKRQTVDEEALRQLQRKQPLPVVQAILEWRKLEKLRSSYIEPLVAAAARADHTLRCGFTPDATETWRFSSSTHPLGGGLNLQTMPSSLRHLVRAPAGRVFVQPDLSQAEARYVAYRARCTQLIALFDDPSRSVHLERARQIFGREVEKGSLEYKRAKSAVHAANYREGPKRLALQLSVSQAEAKQMLQAALSPYPEIGAWHLEVKELVRTQGKLVNCWGQERRCYTALGMRLVTGELGDHEWKELIAWEPQSAIPQIINQAMMQVDARDVDDEVWWHVHGHDAFLASVPEERVDWWVEVMIEALSRPLLVQGRQLIIPVDFQVGWTWGQMVTYTSAWQDVWKQHYAEPPPPERAIEKAMASLSLGELLS